MIKSISTLLILFSALILSGQNITLLKNYNPKAKELKHSLNKTKDSLILVSENTILKVEIFNEDYEDVVVVEGHNARIGLNKLPVGKFVVEAKLTDKVIVMDLIKYEDFNETTNSAVPFEKKDVAEGRGMMLDESLNLVKSTPKRSVGFMLNRGKTKKQSQKKQKFYWTITIVNNEIGSIKTMRLVDHESVERMIVKNKIVNKGSSNKLNELIVWEVYNKTKFMEHQVSNPDFIYSPNSEYFNTTPHYSTKNSVQSL
ncbi:hypothetical protein [uncultured Winogradskyella sp.]|uniref:hypothetical protein n=1 Tax=uncultured Winogradskyella sp. TaxID=395353 RepID=UPI00260A02CE|nr:hypothetical protein [uncultured Winogradskyella sp.]